MTRVRILLTALAGLPAGCATPAPMPHVHHSIDYLELAVTDMAAAQAFYGAAFGWTFQAYGDDYTGIRRPDGSEFAGLRREERVVRGGPLLVLYSTDLAATQAAIEAAGGRIVKPVFAFPGGRRFHFLDPSDNELAVWSDR